MSCTDAEPESALREAISAAMVELYAAFYAHDRTTATTSIDGNFVARANRKHSTRPASEYELEDRSPVSDRLQSAIKRDDARRFQAALGEAQAEVITVAFYGQLTRTEIATQLGLPAGTIKGRMRLGMQKLNADVKRSEVF
jgi:DNA-directed RNA polymerase specialized sigma24 family protein